MQQFLKVVLTFALSVWGLNAIAEEYHNKTTWVNHFDYSEYTFTYEEDGETKTARLTDEAFTPAHQKALLKAVYTDPTIPGIQYGYNYNDTQYFKLDYNYNGHCGEKTDPKNYWLGGPDDFYPNPDQNGMTMLIVQVKDSWKADKHSKYNGEEYFEHAVYSIKLIPDYMRVNDPENPGYLFTTSNASNRFFFISKGKARASWLKPFFRMFEQISPVNALTGEQLNDETFIDELRSGKTYSCYHDCANVFSIGKGHWFTTANNGEYYTLNNLSIFVPDRRFEYEHEDPAEGKDDETTFNEYGNSQNGNENTIVEQLPHVVLYNANLEATAVPAEEKGYFKVHLDWGSAFTGMDVVPEHFYVYNTDGETRNLLATIKTQPTTEHTHEFLVPQSTDEQVFHFVITAAPIVFDDEGKIVTNEKGEPIATITADSPVRTVIVPGRSPYFSKDADIRSRYEIKKEKNIYKNKIVISPTTLEDFTYIKNNTKPYNLTRTDEKGNKAIVATVQFAVNSKIDGYDYLVVYNDKSQDTKDLFDEEKPVNSGSFSIYEEATVTIIDRFSASTAKNDHPSSYTYHFEQADGEYSNALHVKVHKTEFEITPQAFTREQVDNDYDRALDGERFTKITFDAVNDPISNINDYSIYNINWSNSITKAGKAENYNNQGEYHLFGISSDGYLNEDQGIVKIDHDGGKISIMGRNVDPNSTTNNYVPVITAAHETKSLLYNTYGCDIKKMKYAKLSVHLKSKMKSRPFLTARGREMGYSAVIEITPILSDDISRAYYYRVWRDNGDGTSTYLEPVTLLNELDDVSDPSWDAFADYEALRDCFPCDGTNKICINDLYIDKAFDEADGEEKVVTYYVRMYATNEQGYNDYFKLGSPKRVPTRDFESKDESEDYNFFVSELPITVVYDSSVRTAINSIAEDNEVSSVTYYNMLGVSSDQPYDGMNVVVTHFKNGNVKSEKVIF